MSGSTQTGTNWPFLMLLALVAFSGLGVSGVALYRKPAKACCGGGELLLSKVKAEDGPLPKLFQLLGVRDTQLFMRAFKVWDDRNPNDSFVLVDPAILATNLPSQAGRPVKDTSDLGRFIEVGSVGDPTLQTYTSTLKVLRPETSTFYLGNVPLYDPPWKGSTAFQLVAHVATSDTNVRVVMDRSKLPVANPEWTCTDTPAPPDGVDDAAGRGLADTSYRECRKTVQDQGTRFTIKVVGSYKENFDALMRCADLTDRPSANSANSVFRRYAWYASTGGKDSYIDKWIYCIKPDPAKYPDILEAETFDVGQFAAAYYPADIVSKPQQTACEASEAE